MHVGLLVHAQRALALAPKGNTSMNAHIQRLSIQVRLILPFPACCTTVPSLCNNCFVSQQNCLYIKLSLFRAATVVSMQ